MTHTTHRLIVDDKGYLRCIHNPALPLHELGKVKTTRIGRIVPLFYPKRMLFNLLRRCFGERGRVAAFTRRWKCTWKVEMIRCGAWSVFEKRCSAEVWERQHIEACDKCNLSNQAKWEL